MQPSRFAHATRYWVFRGTARSGQSVAWGTTAQDCAPLMMEPPSPFSVGPMLVVGEPPPAVATSITLADPGGEIAALVLPDRRGRQGLSGKLYVGEIVEGMATERAATPTLHATGNTSHQDGMTTIHLQSDDSSILGRSIAMWTVQEVLGGRLREDHSVYVGSSSLVGLPVYGKNVAELLGEIRTQARDNLTSIVPWVYGPAEMELLPLTSEYPRVWVEGIRTADDIIHGQYDLRFTLLKYEGDVVTADPEWSDTGDIDRVNNQVLLRRPLGIDIPMMIEDKLGNPREVWVRFFIQPDPPEEEPSRYVLIQSRITWGLTPAQLANKIAWKSPPSILAQIIRDHARSGIAGLHWASWEKTIDDVEPLFGRVCGGAFGSDVARISEVIQHIAPICGLRLWLGADDLLHAGVAGYTYEDAKAAQSDLLALEEGDIYPRDANNSPSFSQEIIGDPDDDSAGVARVSIEWSDLQREVFPLETSSTLPSIVHANSDLGRERILSGAWIYPPRGADVALALMSGMPSDTVRAQIATHLSVHQVAVHQMLRVTHPAGLGLPGRGWNYRLTRVDGVEVLPPEDATRLILTDLGLSERLRLGLLDAVKEWILYPASPGEKIIIEPKDDKTFIIKNLNAYFTTDWDHGITIWTPGAEIPEYRRSWRAIEASGNDLLVLAHGTPDLGVSTVDEEHADAVLGVGWAVMRTDFTDPDYRENFIRACDIETGFFESERQGFQWSAF